MNLTTLHSYSRQFVRVSVYVLVVCWFVWIWGPLVWNITRGIAANPQSSQLIPTEITSSTVRS